VTSRLAPLPPDSLDGEQAALYEVIAHGRRASGTGSFRLTNDDGSLTGPFNALLYSPGLGHALQAVGEKIRFSSSIPPGAREIAILTVAADWHSDFEQYAHEAVALELGMAPAVLHALRDDVAPPLDDPIEIAVHSFCVSLVRREPIDDESYRRTVELVGEATVIELTVLVGYYTTLAMLLDVFRVDASDEEAPACS
jgi:4-carboxymuconolactone decarboxylase